MTREIYWDAGLRGRLGYAFGGKTLFYVTGGGAYARIETRLDNKSGQSQIAIASQLR